MIDATHVRAPAQPSTARHPYECPLWCSKAGDHAPDHPDGARVHQHRLSPAVAVVQVDHPGGWSPAVVVIEDIDLMPEQTLEFIVDVAAAGRLIETSAR